MAHESDFEMGPSDTAIRASQGQPPMTAKLSAEEVERLEALATAAETAKAISNGAELDTYADYIAAANPSVLLRLAAQVREAEALIADLQAHAKEAGWQDVDEPIAALLAYPLPPPPSQREGRE